MSESGDVPPPQEIHRVGILLTEEQDQHVGAPVTSFCRRTDGGSPRWMSAGNRASAASMSRCFNLGVCSLDEAFVSLCAICQSWLRRRAALLPRRVVEERIAGARFA